MDMRSRILMASTVVLALAAPVAAQNSKPVPVAVGDVFPTLKSESLTGRKAVLPDDAKGKTALVLMGFSYDSRFPVEEWSKAFKAAVAGRTDVTFYEVPVIGGMGRMAKWFIDSGMRKGTPKELHENVITVYGSVDRWKTVMGFTKADEKAAFLALLDGEGRVIWKHHGPFEPAAFDTLKAALPQPVL
jgi:hypothetical protein